MDSSEPVAWAVHYGLDPDPEVHWELYPRHAAESGHMIVPLYRSPSLTDAEREAIQTAMNAYGDNNDDRECEMIEATLRGLLERTK